MLGNPINLGALLLKASGEAATSEAVWTATPLDGGSGKVVSNAADSTSASWSAQFIPSKAGTYEVTAKINTNLRSEPYSSNKLTLTIVRPDLPISGPAAVVAGDNKAGWTAELGNKQACRDVRNLLFLEMVLA